MSAVHELAERLLVARQQAPRPKTMREVNEHALARRQALLGEINKRYTWCEELGCVICDPDSDYPKRLTLSTFRTTYNNIAVWSGRGKCIGLGTAWLEWSGRRTHQDAPSSLVPRPAPRKRRAKGTIATHAVNCKVGGAKTHAGGYLAAVTAP